MPFNPLIAAGIETILNAFLWRDKALKPARQRLSGKVLRIELKELSAPIVLIFSEQQVDILGAWEDTADCTVMTTLNVLPQLRNRQQLMTLIRRGDLQVQGDLQVVQNMVTLCDQAEFDPAELLAPFTGDIIAEGLGKILHKGSHFLGYRMQCQQRYLAEVLTEEWRLAPGALEVAWFAEEVAATQHSLIALEQRLDKLEGQ